MIWPKLTVIRTELIITQGLNFGSDQVVSWIKENYSDDQIKYVATHPLGIWFRERLRNGGYLKC